MTAPELKKKIKALLSEENSERTLREVYSLLSKETKTGAVQRRVREVAEESDKDIKAGRVKDWDKVHSEMQALIDRQERTAALRRPGVTRKA